MHALCVPATFKPGLEPMAYRERQSPMAQLLNFAPTKPGHVNPVLWQQSVGIARQACARFFRDGGTPRAAVDAFGLATDPGNDWSRAVEAIAEALSTRPMRKAA